MHILYVLHALPWNELTGTTVVLDNYIKEASKRNLKVTVLVPDSSYTNVDSCPYGSEVKVLSFKNQPNWGINGFDMALIQHEFDAPELESKPDFIHIIDWVNFHPSVFVFLRNIGSPIIRSVCNFEEFCPLTCPVYFNETNDPCQPPVSSEQCIECTANNSQLKVVDKLYSYKNLFYALVAYKDNYKSAIAYFLENRKNFVEHLFDNYFDGIVFPSKSFARFFSNQIGRDLPGNVIPHGIDLCELPERTNAGQPLKIIYTGGDQASKGWDIVSHAVQILSADSNDGIEIHFVGSGSNIADGFFENQNLRLIKSPQYSQSNKSAVLNCFDVALAPSHFESYGLFVRECVKSNVLPLVIPSPGINDFIVDGYNGIVLEKPYAESLAKNVRMLADNRDLLSTMRANLGCTHIPDVSDEFNALLQLYNTLKR